MRRFSTSLGMPALGCTINGSMHTPTAVSTALSKPSGPLPQFIPQATGAGSSPGKGASICWIGSPEADSHCPTTASESTKGSAGNCRMAAAHRSTARRLGCVSKRMKSAPPSRRAVACRTIISATASSCWGCEGNGPIEPATNTSRSACAATSRASRAPAQLISSVFSPKPYLANATRLAPKVLVVSTSAPASQYSWWISWISLGSDRHSSSNERLVKTWWR